MKHVLYTLIQNALEATSPPGELRLETCRRGHEVVVTIADTGHGIAPDRLQRLFEIGFTQRSGRIGLSLGLPVACAIVARSRGSIEVKSELGRGTHVELCFPAAEPGGAADDAAGGEVAGAAAAGQTHTAEGRAAAASKGSAPTSPESSLRHGWRNPPVRWTLRPDGHGDGTTLSTKRFGVPRTLSGSRGPTPRAHCATAGEIRPSDVRCGPMAMATVRPSPRSDSASDAR